MMIDRKPMRTLVETAESMVENKQITKESLMRYIEGCEELAVRLDTVIEKVAESGKRPVILIPSRGAVPIFLLARRFLNDLQQEASPLSDQNARYYPRGVFNYLEGKAYYEPDKQTTADVILFPFTADVSLENTDDEVLARELRNSCVRSVMQMVRGINYGKHDLEWYKFLMRKLADNPKDPEELKPKEILESLATFTSSENNQIILIDTVISGRASNDITNAFKALGHTVIPLLAVDNTKGGKFEGRRKREIEETVRSSWDLMHENGPFIEFPLITEDKGAALLGLVALNFINFNESGIFHEANTKFESDLRPQSCVWTLAPSQTRDLYLKNFREFIETAWNLRNGSKDIITEQEVDSLATASKLLTSTHTAPIYAQVNTMVAVEKDTDLKESASHIVSVKLPKKKEAQWLQEFSSAIAHSAP